MKILTSILIFSCCILASVSDLSFSGVKCGTTLCKEFEFCSEYDNLCQPCSTICNKDHHNVDHKKCEDDCQNYLHEIRYGKHENIESNSELRSEVRYLHYMVSITLTLTCITLLCVGVVFIAMVIRCKRKYKINMAWIRQKLFSKKKSDKHMPSVSVTHASGKPDLRLDMPSVHMNTPGTMNTPSTATTTLSRRPTEDSTLDYAYDNPAMASTPSPNSKPHESSL